MLGKNSPVYDDFRDKEGRGRTQTQWELIRALEKQVANLTARIADIEAKIKPGKEAE